MGSVELPLVDLSVAYDGLQPGTIKWAELREQVFRACQSHGAFRILYNRMPSALYKDIFEVAREIFELPLEAKERNVVRHPYPGNFAYIAKDPLYPFFECANIDGAPDPVAIRAFVERMWPDDGNPKAFETLKLFSNEFIKLDWIIKRMILECLGVEKHHESLIKSSFSQCRYMKYTNTKPDQSNMGLPAHTDKNFLSLLYEDQIGGLEIMSRDGRWSEVMPLPNSFIAFVGDGLKAWSNDKLHHALHRVMVKGGTERYSLGYFSVPNIDIEVDAPEELMDANHPRVYRPYNNVEYLQYYYSDKLVEPTLYSFARIPRAPMVEVEQEM